MFISFRCPGAGQAVESGGSPCRPGISIRSSSTTPPPHLSLFERRSTAVLTPHKKVGMKAGKWLSSVAVDASEDWLGCGGGVPGTIWHLRSNTFVTALKSKGVENHSISEVTFTKGGVRVQF